MGECDCIIIGERGMHARAKITMKISVVVVGEGMEKSIHGLWLKVQVAAVRSQCL